MAVVGNLITWWPTLQKQNVPRAKYIFRLVKHNILYIYINLYRRIKGTAAHKWAANNWLPINAIWCIYCKQMCNKVTFRVWQATHSHATFMATMKKLLNGGCGTAKLVAILPHVPHPDNASGLLTEHGRRVKILTNIQNDLFHLKNFTNFIRKFSIYFVKVKNIPIFPNFSGPVFG